MKKNLQIVGRLEARLPFASILLPKEFIKKYPHTLAALYVNSKKMTTQFDFHTTLLNIAAVSDILNSARSIDKSYHFY